jgi:group I intron endonuclease
MTRDRICGVYSIRCKISNLEYVGSSWNITHRWGTHKRELRSGKHRNKHLQGHWRKYGEETFEFLILENCSRSKTIERETVWIKRKNSFEDGYNQTPTAEPLKFMSRRAKAAVRERTIFRNKTISQTAEQRAQAGQRLIQINKTLPHSEERRRLASERAKQMHIEGRLKAPVRTTEQHENSRQLMLQMWKDGRIKGGFVSEEHRAEAVTLCKAGVLNTPVQRQKASQTLKDWHISRVKELPL